MSEWDGIDGFSGWTAKLRSLLKEAQELPADCEVTDRLDLSQRFVDFVKKSNPSSDEINALDEIAKQASVDVLMDGIVARNSALAKRSGDLAGVGKTLENLANKNEEEAASIRLDRIHKTASALTDTIRSINELRAVLKDTNKDDAVLLGKLNELLKDIDSVRSAVEG